MIDIIIDFHKDNQYLGPGDSSETLKALSYIEGLNENSIILDAGCGTGSQTFTLAGNTNAKIVAIDLFSQFISKVADKVNELELCERVEPMVASIDDLPFGYSYFDLIWSEGAVYNIGFERGIKIWKNYLKKGGIVALTEISWTTESRPKEIEDYWNNNYSEMATVAEKLRIIENAGYKNIAHFQIDEKCWLENYYAQNELRFEEFELKYQGNKLVKEFIEIELEEIEYYKKFKDYFGYVFYIFQK